MPTIEQLQGAVRALERRVQAIEDVEAIKRLKARYGALADARYGAEGVKSRAELEVLAGEIAALFTEDAVWEGGPALGRCQGRKAIYERFLHPTLSFSWHYFVKPQIRIAGERAQGTWDVLAPCTTADGRPCWMAGVEEDEYRKVGGEWLHHRLRLAVVFFAPHDRGWARRAGAG